MSFQPACLINIGLAFIALSLYVIGSYRFYRNKEPFLIYFGMAILVDASTALLASFRITPTTQLPGCEIVP